MSDALLSGAIALSCFGRSTSDLVYGSHDVAVAAELVARFELPFCGNDGLGGRPDQLRLAALAAAGGGRLRILLAIFPPDDARSLLPARNVFNMPPFFSGLGVLALELSPTGVVRLDDNPGCKLLVRGISSAELFVVLYEGRGGCAGRRSVNA